METFIIAILKAIIFIVLFLSASAFLTYIERRVSAFIQDRLGPNRVGPFGLFQPIADVIKIIFKEEIIPANADRTLHTIAPIISLFVAYSVFAVIPLAEKIVIDGKEIKPIVADVNIGFLYILALSSLGVYGVTLSGWSSNNKYSLLGALRASAQMISYELSLGLSLIGVVLVSGSVRIDEIIRSQANVWNIFYQPLGFIIFLVSVFAETNRLPFDLPEAEAELVAGYHTEYSGMKFGAFYLAEYTNIITSSLLVTAFYLGGWYFPIVDIYRGMSPNLAAIFQIIVFFAKAGLIIFLFMLVRWTLPRFRYDQLMRLGWQVLLPLALLNVLVTGLVKILI